MKHRKEIEELHRDMPEKVLMVLYGNEDTKELRNILKKFKNCRNPDEYMLKCIQVIENELKERNRRNGN